MFLALLFLFKSFAIEIPPERYYFGFETTVTSKDLMQSTLTDELKRFAYSYIKFPIDLIPEHEVYFKRIHRTYWAHPYHRNLLKWDGRNRPGVYVVNNGVAIFYKFDSHVIEINMNPFQAENFKKQSSDLKKYLFDVPQSVGLWPMRNWGMHHFHLDVENAVDCDPLFYRNFWVYEFAEHAFYEMVGENIQSRTVPNNLELSVVFEFIQTVIDPLIVEWKREPRLLTNQEILRLWTLFPGLEVLKLKLLQTQSTKVMKPKSKPHLRRVMGLQIIRILHEGLMRLVELQIKHKGALSTLPRRIDRAPFIQMGSRRTIEWRRIPGLKSVEEIELWMNYFIYKMEFVRKHKGFMYLRPPDELITSREKVENFNSHLLQIGLLPELYRPFLRPQFQTLRVPIDLCRLHLNQKMPSQFF